MRHRTVRRATVAALAALGLATASACTADTADDPAETIATPTNTEGTDGTDTADTRSDEDDGDAAAPGLPASLHTADGAELGTVEFHERDGGVEVRAVLSGMDPGFYGFHIHAVGECEPDSASPDDPEDTGDFMSAGSHLNPTDAQHPDHAGDMPPAAGHRVGRRRVDLLHRPFHPRGPGGRGRLRRDHPLRPGQLRPRAGALRGGGPGRGHHQHR